MAQYANPHLQQPQQGYGQPYPQPQYPPQQQPQIPLGQTFVASDGRTYVMTQQGAVIVQPVYPQQQMPQPGFVRQMPQYQPGFMPAGPQPMPIGQQQMPQQGSFAPLPVYGGQAPVVAPTVYPNPQAGVQSNRFGEKEQQMPAAVAPTTQPPPQSLTESAMQLVSQDPTSTKKKTGLVSDSFTPIVRTLPFTSGIVRYPSLIMTDCLDGLVEAAVEKTVTMKDAPLVGIYDGIMSLAYHKANKAKYCQDLLQPDIKAVYKAFKHHVGNITNRYDMAFVSAINEFLTALINDLMRPMKNNDNVFENFATDFNDLLRTIRNSDTAETEDLLIECVNEILGKMGACQELSDSLEQDEEIAADEAEVSPKPVAATLHLPVSVICMNYLNEELGDNKNLTDLVRSVANYSAQQGHELYVAFVCTIDKTIYKACINGDKVFVNLIRN